MNHKLALVDIIENIKEKLTDKEYKDILESLSKIKVTKEKFFSEEEYNSEEEEEEEIYIPYLVIKLWDGTNVVERNLQSFNIYDVRSLAKMSRALGSFIGAPRDIYVLRPTVTRAITKYVKDHNLQKQENKRVICLDRPGGQPLRDVLQVPMNEELTFFNLQKYLKNHLIDACNEIRTHAAFANRT